MAETFGVNTDGMIPAVTSLDDVVNRLRGVYNLAAQQLPDPDTPLGDPGRDQIAAAVNDNFLPVVGSFLVGLRNAGTVLDQAGMGVGTMVRGFDETEQENADSVRTSGPDPA